MSENAVNIEASGSSSSGSTTPTKVNLRGMLKLDSLEDLMGELLTKIRHHDDTLTKLRSDVERCLGTSEADAMFHDLHNQHQVFKDQIEQLSNASTVVVDNREISASDMLTLHRAQLAQLSAGVEAGARRVDVERELVEIGEKHQGDLLHLRNQTASLSMGLRLKEAQQDSAERLTGLEKLVSLKLDKSDIGHIEAMSENLERFEDFRVGTLAAVGHLTSLTQEHGRRLDSTEAVQADHATKLAKLRADVEGSAKRIDLRSVAMEMEALKKSVTSAYVHRAEGDENLKRLQELEMRADESDRFAGRTGAALDATEKVLGTKASVEDMQSCVLRKHFEQVVRTLGEDLDTRATILHVGDVEARTRSLEADMETTTERMDVAIRFVDWFTNRGEQYEHNIRVIDKHMGNLANNQRPAERNAFQGEMRFTEVMGEGGHQGEGTAGRQVRYQGHAAGLGVHSPSSAAGGTGAPVDDVSALLNEAASLVAGTKPKPKR
jgi:hypothetical protein